MTPEQYQHERDRIALEVMRAIYERLPYGQQITLADGSVAEIQKYEAPGMCDSPGHHYEGRARFGLDVKIKGGPVDFLEITAFNTGSGMAVEQPKPEVKVDSATQAKPKIGRKP